MQAAADSFGERDVASFIGTHAESTKHIDFLGLAALEDLASLLLEPGSDGERLSARLRETVRGRDLASAIGAGFSGERTNIADVRRETAVHEPALHPPANPAPTPPIVPAPPAFAPPAMPLAESLDPISATLIDSSIAALEALDSRRLADPLPDATVVPIDALLYRGRAALDRAVEIRDELRSEPSANPTALEELFDLLELARAE
jgi:hypothetical protein